MIKGLIFDFDGLILDTETPMYAAWQDIYNRYGCILSYDQWALSLGSDYSAFDPVTDMETQLRTDLNRQEIMEENRILSLKLLEAEIALPGVRHTLELARQKGLKTAIASSSGFDWVGPNLTRLGLIDLFDCIRTADDVEHVKPEPDLFLSALNCLELNPKEAIVFEDSSNGILAAKTAGIFSVAIPNPITARLEFSYADLRLKTMDELPLDELLEQASRANGM